VRLPVLLAAGSLTLAGVAGGLATAALSGSSQEPTSTTTITIPGPAVFDCGTGFHVGLVTFVQPGQGPTTMKTCVKN
jgi:hypothetical protein